MLRRTVRALPFVALQRVAVVCGSDAADVIRSLTGLPVETLYNDEFAEGMGTSVSCGVRHLTQSQRAGAGLVHPTQENTVPAGIMVCLGDMPLIPPEVYTRLIDAFSASPTADIVVPVYGSKPGHPRLFRNTCFDALATLTGDTGAKSLLQDQRFALVEVPCENPGIHQDFDTLDSLHTLRSAASDTDHT